MMKMRVVGIAVVTGLLTAPGVAQKNDYAVKVALQLSGLSSRPHKISKLPDNLGIKVVSGNRSLFIDSPTRCKIQWLHQTEGGKSEYTILFLDRITNWPKVGGPRYLFSSSKQPVVCTTINLPGNAPATGKCLKRLDLRDDDFEWAKDAEDFVMSAIEHCNLY